MRCTFITRKSFCVGAIVLTLAVYIPDVPLLYAQLELNGGETKLIGSDKQAIFYNAYINPENVYLSIGVIVDQLAIWRASRYANATLYYSLLGDTSISFPCPANGKCQKLMPFVGKTQITM
jgi:hypothetical protein